MSLKNFFLRKLKLGGSREREVAAVFTLARFFSTSWGSRSVEPRRNLLHLTSSLSSRYSFSTSTAPSPLENTNPQPSASPKSVPKIKYIPPAIGKIIYYTHTVDTIGEPSRSAAGFCCFSDSLQLLGLDFQCLSVPTDITTLELMSLEAALAFAAVKGHRKAAFRSKSRTALNKILAGVHNPKSIGNHSPSDQEVIRRIISFIDDRVFDQYCFEVVSPEANELADTIKWENVKMLTLSFYWEDGWVPADLNQVLPELSNLIRNWMMKLTLVNPCSPKKFGFKNPYSPIKFGRHSMG